MPVLLASPDAALVMAHVGWRGLAKGAVSAAVERVRQAGPGAVTAWIGPHIRPCCYEFDASDIEVVAQALGVDVAEISAPYPQAVRAAQTPPGSRRALDMGAAVTGELVRCGVLDIRGVPSQSVPCTGCDGRWFSWRQRAETERHVMAAWWE